MAVSYGHIDIGVCCSREKKKQQWNNQTLRILRKHVAC